MFLAMNSASNILIFPPLSPETAGPSTLVPAVGSGRVAAQAGLKSNGPIYLASELNQGAHTTSSASRMKDSLRTPMHAWAACLPTRRESTWVKNRSNPLATRLLASA